MRHAEVRDLGLREHELLDETSGIEELVDPFSGREFALGMLLLGRLGFSLEGLLLQLRQSFL